ncbi:hypothetical protein SDC9_174572 [bioreactor metagenome]
MKKNPSSEKNKRDLTKLTTPHTYVIIFGVVIFAWILTFLVPAGRFSTQEIEYQDANGETSTRTVLRQDSFRYAYALDKGYVFDQLEKLQDNPAEREKLDVPEAGLEDVLAAGEKQLTQEKLDEIALTDEVLYDEYGDNIYDTSKKLHKTARV